MTCIDNIVHYIYLILVRLVLIGVFWLKSWRRKKRDTILHNIHPCPFDSYVGLQSNDLSFLPFYIYSTFQWVLTKQILSNKFVQKVCLKIYSKYGVQIFRPKMQNRWIRCVLKSQGFVLDMTAFLPKYQCIHPFYDQIFPKY